MLVLGSFHFLRFRDRNGKYEPHVIKKYQNTLKHAMEEKIMSMYAKSMATGDIESHLSQ